MLEDDIDLNEVNSCLMNVMYMGNAQFEVEDLMLSWQIRDDLFPATLQTSSSVTILDLLQISLMLDGFREFKPW